jgi:hypothetical protein
VIILNDFRTKLIYISLLKQQFLSAGLRNPKTLRKEKKNIRKNKYSNDHV